MKYKVLVAMLVFLLPAVGLCSDPVAEGDPPEFPLSLESYDDAH